MAVSREYLAFLEAIITQPRLRKLTAEMADLHVRKNAGYAGQDNPDAWANFRESEQLGVIAFAGCLVRLSDKWIRIKNILRDPTNEQVGEKITDTLMDMAAYALIAINLYWENTEAVLKFYQNVRNWYDNE